jgi:hypothetical protein
MKNRILYGVGVVVALFATAACETVKSSNPLTPTVAGPIPGVNISAPKLLEPQSGTKIEIEKQPITLLIENSSSNGVRPLNYTFEIATDAAFANKVFSREAVAPGENGRTSLKLPDALASGGNSRSYHWRARAQDGANTGSFAASTFDVFTPIVIREPVPTAPAPNATVTTLRPPFTVTNAQRSGPVGAISYLIEVASDGGFGNKIAAWTAAESSGSQTTFNLPRDLAYNTVYYWHVRAFDPTTTGPWSATRAFQTFPEPAPEPVPIPGPSGPTGPVANDAFSLAGASVYASPAGVASWPATTTIASISFRSDGVAVEFSKKNGPGRWPDVTPPGWSGAIQYTLWIAMNIGGRWHTCGTMEYWFGLAAQGGDVTRNNQIAANWTYQCGPMARQPAPGEQVGFFVTAGDQRLKDVAATHERSNTIIVSFPTSAGQTFTF